ncbi:MAG: hypothetical protein ABSF23_18455 [Terracidiphilus sp.]|jgi:hypothetical protein
MKTSKQTLELVDLAARALTALLAQVSGIRIEEMQRKSTSCGAGLLARIDVYGHRHFLACAVNPGGEPEQLLAALIDSSDAFPAPADAARLIIAPRLSPEAQALCKQHRAGFLDLEGNARLSVGELFISTRSIPCRTSVPAPAAVPRPHVRVPAHISDRNRLWHLSRNPAGAPLPA